MNIFSFLVMAYSLNFGVIVPDWSDTIIEEAIPIYVEMETEFMFFNRVYISGGIESIFSKEKENPISCVPALDTYKIEIGLKINDNFKIYTNHYCTHKVMSSGISKITNTGFQSMTKIGVKIQN